MIKSLSEHSGSTSSRRMWLLAPRALAQDIDAWRRKNGLNQSEAVRALVAMGLGRRDQVEAIITERRAESATDAPVSVSERILTVLEEKRGWEVTVPEITHEVLEGDPEIKPNTVAQILCRMARQGKVRRENAVYWLEEKM